MFVTELEYVFREVETEFWILLESTSGIKWLRVSCNDASGIRTWETSGVTELGIRESDLARENDVNKLPQIE
jgi:hypothetical protein